MTRAGETRSAAGRKIQDPLVIIAVSTYGTVITQRLAMFDDLQSCQAAAQAQVATQQVLHTADVHWRCEPAW